MVKIRNVALSYPDRIFSLENFQILVPVEIWKFFKFSLGPKSENFLGRKSYLGMEGKFRIMAITF